MVQTRWLFRPLNISDSLAPRKSQIAGLDVPKCWSLKLLLALVKRQLQTKFFRQKEVCFVLTHKLFQLFHPLATELEFSEIFGTTRAGKPSCDYCFGAIRGCLP